jgi:hypothetical protein
MFIIRRSLDKMEERIMLGGFFYENIKNWIIKECLESGDPVAFFENIKEVIDDLADETNKEYYLDIFEDPT